MIRRRALTIPDRVRRLRGPVPPWWAGLAVGLTAFVLAAWLVADPVDLATRLRLVFGAALVVSALRDPLAMDARPRAGMVLAAGVWQLAVGILALAWPGMTVRTIVVLLGLSLLVGGLVELGVAVVMRGDERFLLGAGGVTDALLGVTALAWPTATVLVAVAILIGWLVLFGVREVILAWRRRAGSNELGRSRPLVLPGWIRVVGSLVALGLAAGAAAISVSVTGAQPDEPGQFYDTPAVTLGAPGTLLRSEPIDPFVGDATAQRILYTTTDDRGRPATASGIVVIPEGAPPPNGRPIVAVAHGTSGIARRCAPSLLGSDYAPFIPGLAPFLAQGWIVVATDYVGLGTDGTVAYLVGDAEAVAVLDSIRAVQGDPDAHASRSAAVWGESQGGHAALFAGQRVAAYAPDIDLVGVAVAAPATDLAELFRANAGTTFGDILAAYALASWSHVYDGAELDDIVVPEARVVVDRVASLCIGPGKQTIALLPEAELLKLDFLGAQPWEQQPWRRLLAENTPGRAPTPAPIMIAQGLADPLVLPSVQRQFVQGLCDIDQTVDYREYDGVGHLDAGAAAAPDVTRWLAERFEGAPSGNTC